MLKHIHTVGDLQRRGRVLLDNQDGGAVFPDLLDRIEDQAFQARCDADRWFVEQQQFWPPHQRAADGHHLLFAAGQCAGLLPLPFAQHWKQREDAFEVRVDLGFVAAEISAELEVL